MKRKLLRHAHLSGKFSVHSDLFRKALTALSTQADVITLTEVSPLHFAAWLEAWAKTHGWFLYHPEGAGKDECAVLSRTPIEKYRTTRLTPLTLKKGRVAPIYLIEARVQGVWFAVWHSPAHNGGLSEHGQFAWPTRVYLDAMAGLKLARQHMRGKVVLVGDWNLDLGRSAVRQRLTAKFPHLMWGWAPGQKATEGGRVIDGVLTNLRIAIATLTLPALDGFDHRPIVTVYQL